MTNLADNLTATASRHGERPAVRLGDTAVTYAQLQDQAQRVATMLTQRGVGPGDRVGLVLPNVLEFPALFYGALSVGAIVVPMNPLLKDREVQYYLEDSGAAIVFAWKDMAGEAGKAAAAVGIECVSVDPADFTAQLAAFERTTEVVSRNEDDTVVLLYTSGTTGQPKGAELTHFNMMTNAAVTAETLLHLTEDDMVMGCLPLFHCFGLTCGLNASVLSGSCLALIPRFDPFEALETIQGAKVSIFIGVPTMYARMLHAEGREAFDVSSLRSCISGGSAMPVEVMKNFEAAFDCIILEGYGLSETSPVACFNQPGMERKTGTIGVPVRGVEMKLVDDDDNDVPVGEIGEIAIKGEPVMKGYWGREDATNEAIRDGWFHSGDLAEQDADGYFTIVDRKKDLIIRGGYNVYPREVEEALYEHDAVAEAAVIGIPNDDLGEEVGAAVALKSGSTVDAEGLREFAKSRVAAYKYPRNVWIVDELPKGPTGKILRREISAPEDALS